ncbi:HAD-IIIC family phosphatase [Streptomyces sp. NBC_00433]
MSVPEEDVFGLLRAGLAAGAYPRLRGLLAGLPDADLQRAGRLLARLDPAEVLREHPGTPVVKVSVTGHGTLSALVPALTAQAARHGLLLRPHVSAFDSWIFELSDPGSGLYAADGDLTLCVLDPFVVFDEVPVPWGPKDVERVLAEKLATLERLVKTFDAAGRGGVLVLNTIPLPRRWTAQLVDLRSRAELGAVWREANARLLRLAGDSVAVVDLDPLVAEGVPVTDPRMSAYAKDHLSAELIAGYAREVVHLARSGAGRTKKALVVDLDETLWGGVLSEEGIDGIEIGEGYRGEAFAAFQRVVKQIGSQGVVLAVASKNDAEPVSRALREREGMVLREEDFVRVTANWRPKHENLTELAAALNIGVDSLVFADDSPFECGLVGRQLPEVAVVRLDEEPALHIERLLADGWFDVREVTAEDRARTSRYRDEMVRADFRESFTSVDDYLEELDIRVELAVPSDREVPRVSQLTLRTNQFNLTTRRLQPAEVSAWIADPAGLVLRIASSDRFGENGLVGAVFARWEEKVLRIDNIVLSCRVFSRGIEQACLAAVLAHARSEGASAVTGGYRPTAKNAMVSDFYPRHGFVPLDGGDGSAASFRHDLDGSSEPDGTGGAGAHDRAGFPAYVQLTTTLSGVPR